jgi:tetratricopeptide (TPR) repeat protein
MGMIKAFNNLFKTGFRSIGLLVLFAFAIFSGCTDSRHQVVVVSPSPPALTPSASPASAVINTPEPSPADNNTGNSPSSAIEEAQILAKKGQNAKASALLRSEISKAPENPELYATLSMLFIQSGDNKSALDICEQGLKVMPKNLKLLEEKAAVLMLMEKWGESAKINKKILELFPSDPAASPDMASLARESIGKAYASKKDLPDAKDAYDFAMADLEKDISKNPKDELLLREKAFLLMNAQKYTDAVAVLKTVDEVEKENLFIPLDIGKCYLLAKKYSEAEKQFENTIAKNPKNFRSFRNYGWYQMERGKMEKGRAAVDCFDKSAQQYEKALALATLPIDTSYLQFKAAEAKFHKWKITQNPADRIAAKDAFEKYYKLAPDWSDTDIAEPFMKELR